MSVLFAREISPMGVIKTSIDFHAPISIRAGLIPACAIQAGRAGAREGQLRIA